TSVCGGWVREAQRFTPALRPLVFGDLPDHERAAAVAGLGPGDVLVVSYTFLARERELLSGRPFATLVLDEAQAIKNAQTERAKAARALQADVRIVLSGTPLENHVGELWSLFQVAVPGLLGSWELFRQRFALPIERGDSAERREALSRVLRPFLLRRTKKEVAADLPPRTEIDEYVEPSRAERELYEQARLAAVARVKGVAGSMSPEKARFEVLAAITRLRLVSCHPALYDPDSTVPSSKLERTLELLAQLREEGHRALVFSQFTSHLGLVRRALEDAGMRVLYLDGGTPGGERQALVDAFQAGEADHFLISLKAGGFGLNLTAADFVLHLDPWWNPAVEDQASDRAHRIGQTRPVTVIRLIARKTIEEQILSLHAQKRELVASILDGSGAAGGLDTADLVRLIEDSAFGISVDAAE
ncbi:MAG TPA: DEAD/DEAH box helicase, partial [Vulgatibacter sp.]